MTADVAIVGGGPAGSSCAWALRRAGADVVVIDRATFPRDKICAGWITPSVVRTLELDLDEYRARGLTLQPIRGFRTGVVSGPAVDTVYDEPVSYAIRRCEFDNYLLERSGARVLMNTPLKTMERCDGTWILNGSIDARVLIGAGGHFCPVARHVGRKFRDGGLVVAQELELPLAPGAACLVDAHAPELYFCDDLDGYGWCVRKGNYLNVGLGRRDDREFPSRVRAFTDWLRATGRLPGAATSSKWHGHAYISCRQRHDAARARHLPSSITRPLGRWLLRSPTCTRRVVLERWFLRSAANAEC